MKLETKLKGVGEAVFVEPSSGKNKWSSERKWFREWSSAEALYWIMDEPTLESVGIIDESL